MEVRLCQERGESISAGEREGKPHFSKHGLPKSQAWGPALCGCYVDSQGQDLESLTFWSEPGPVGLSGRPATVTKMTATFSPIKPKRDVFVTPESIIKNLDSSLPHQVVGLGRCDCKCQGFLGVILWCMHRASSHWAWWLSTYKIHCRGSNDTPTVDGYRSPPWLHTEGHVCLDSPWPAKVHSTPTWRICKDWWLNLMTPGLDLRNHTCKYQVIVTAQWFFPNTWGKRTACLKLCLPWC